MSKIVYIIIPVYNAENYLRKCLDSVFNQTYKSIKIICVNDGSTDESLTILSEYNERHSNLEVINQNNRGVSTARNSALDTLDYHDDTYLTFIDADDWIENDYIEKLVNIIERNNVDIVCSSFFFANEQYFKPYKHIDIDKKIDSIEATRLLIKDETIQSHSYSSLFKTYLWEYVRYKPELFYMEDQDVIFRVFYNSKNIFITNYVGYYYRQDNNNAVTKGSTTNNKVISGLKGYFNVCKYDFKAEDKPKLIPAANNSLAAAYLMLIPYYKRRKSSKDQIIFIKELKKYIRINKLIKNYTSDEKNNCIKKKLYLLCPILYPLLFKLAKYLQKRK